METKSINFSKFQLIHISEETGAVYREPSLETLNKIPDEFNWNKNDTTVYRAKKTITDEYLFISFDHGASAPRSDTIVNVTTLETKSNNRTVSEAELRNQLFLFYDIKNTMLYLQDAKKTKPMLIKMLREIIKEEFQVKEIIVNIDDFIEKIEAVNEIRFTSLHNLWSSNQKQRNALTDLTGTTAPTNFKIETKYKERYKPVAFLKQLVSDKEVGSLGGLVIKGTSSTGFEEVFNTDSFIEKVSISVPKDENGRVEASLVLTRLKSFVENYANAK